MLPYIPLLIYRKCCVLLPSMLRMLMLIEKYPHFALRTMTYLLMLYS